MTAGFVVKVAGEFSQAYEYVPGVKAYVERVTVQTVSRSAM